MSDEEYHPPIARARRRTMPVPSDPGKLFGGRPQEARLPGYYDEDGRGNPATNTASRRMPKTDLKASTGIPTGQNERSGYRSSSTYRHQPLHSPSAGILSRLFRLALFLLLLYVATMCYRYQQNTRSSCSRAQTIRDSQPPLKTLDSVLDSFQELRQLPALWNVTAPKDYDELFKAFNIDPRRKRQLIKQDLSPLASLLKNMTRASLDIKTFVMAEKLFVLNEIRLSMDAVVDVGLRGLFRPSDIPDWIDGGLNALSIVLPVIQRHHTYDPYIGRLRIFTDQMHSELDPLIRRSVVVQGLVHNIILEVEILNRSLEGPGTSFVSKCTPSSLQWFRGDGWSRLCSLVHISQVLQESTQALQKLSYEVGRCTVSLDAFQKVAPPVFLESPEVLHQVRWSVLSLEKYAGEKQKVFDKLK